MSSFRQKCIGKKKKLEIIFKIKYYTQMTLIELFNKYFIYNVFVKTIQDKNVQK